MNLGDIAKNAAETFSSIFWWLAVFSLLYSLFCLWKAWENRRADIYLVRAIAFIFLSAVLFHGSSLGSIQDNCAEKYGDIFCPDLGGSAG